MLHYLDDLDSKMESMRAHFEREASVDNPWTSYNGSLGRPLLNTSKFLSPQTEEPLSAAEKANEPPPVVETPALPVFEAVQVHSEITTVVIANTASNKS